MRWTCLLLLALAGCGAPKLDDVARATYPNETFVELAAGVTHYELSGPEDAPIVVLVHGLTSPMYVWDPQVEPLHEAGYRVLRYDNYGRGLSDRPNVRYDADLYISQLHGLLDAVAPGQPVVPIGLSMGGAIVVNFVDRHPERVAGYGLIAPAGLPYEKPAITRMLRWPCVVDVLAALPIADTLVLAGAKRSANDEAARQAIVERIEPQMKYAGYGRAVGRSLRDFVALDMTPAYTRVGRRGLPALVLWGTDDRLVPAALADRAAELMPRARVERLQGGSHTLSFEEPDWTNARIIEWLDTLRQDNAWYPPAV